MFSGITFFKGRYIAEPTAFQYFPKSMNGSSALPEEDIEGKRSRACRYDGGTFSSVQRFGDSVFAGSYQTVHDPVKQNLERAGHVSPIAGRTDDKGVIP